MKLVVWNSPRVALLLGNGLTVDPTTAFILSEAEGRAGIAVDCLSAKFLGRGFKPQPKNNPPKGGGLNPLCFR